MLKNLNLNKLKISKNLASQLQTYGLGNRLASETF